MSWMRCTSRRRNRLRCVLFCNMVIVAVLVAVIITRVGVAQSWQFSGGLHSGERELKSAADPNNANKARLDGILKSSYVLTS